MFLPLNSNEHDSLFVSQVCVHPRVRGAPGGPVAVQPGGRPAVAPAALLVHSDLQRGSPLVRRRWMLQINV